MALTDTRIRSLRPRDKTYRVVDQRGLYLQITPAGGKLWQFRYRMEGVEKKLSIGSYPEIGLRQARDAAIDARQLVAAGGDPAFDKKKEKLRNEFLAAHSFGDIALEYIEDIMAQNGRAETTIIKAQYFLRQLKPGIGKRPIDKIEPFEILAILKRLEAQGKHETAKKCRSFASRVFRYAAATTRCTTDPTTMLQGALIKPKPSNYAAILDPIEFGGLLRAIDDYSGNMLTRYALLVAPHVFVRPGELRHAEWHEIDLDGAVWKIPPGKMKSRRMHAVPLSRQVVGYLDDPTRYKGEDNRERVISIIRKNMVVADDQERASALYARGHFRQFKRGDNLITQGANDDDVYFLLFGETEILIDGKQRAVRKAPRQVGEMAALDADEPRSATVRATTDNVFVWSVSALDFNELLAADTTAMTRIRRDLSARHREQLIWKPSTGSWRDVATWTILSLVTTAVCTGIAWLATSFLPFADAERVLSTGVIALLTFIFMITHNPAFIWRRLIALVLCGWVGLFVLDWSVSGKIVVGGEDTEISLGTSGLDLDWTIVAPLAAASVLVIGILAFLEHKRMNA